MPYFISRSKSAETFASVIVGVIILSVLAIGIANLLFRNYDLEKEHDRSNILLTLESNATNIVRSMDTSHLPEKQIFSLYRDQTSRQFLIFTGSSDVEKYQYINQDGEYVSDPWSYSGTVYSRFFFFGNSDPLLGKKNNIIKVIVKELIKK